MKRDTLIKRVAVLKKAAGRVSRFVKIREPKPNEPVTRETFGYTFDAAAWKKARQQDGCYLLRAHLPWDDRSVGRRLELSGIQVLNARTAARSLLLKCLAARDGR